MLRAVFLAILKDYFPGIGHMWVWVGVDWVVVIRGMDEKGSIFWGSGTDPKMS